MPTELPIARVRVRARHVATCVLVCISAHAAGCPEPVMPPDVPDAFRIARDVGPIDAFRPDAPLPDTPFPDTGPPPDAWAEVPDAAGRDAGTDAGGSGLVVDGRLVDRVWSTAIERSTVETTFGLFNGTRVSRFLALRTADELAIGLEGTFPLESTVVVMYLDVNYPDVADGVLLGSAGLFDRTGQVDTVLSNAITTIDATFRPELGWGTARRPESITSGSATLGWRLLAQTDAHVLVMSQRNACTAAACETTLPLGPLRVAPGATLGLVVRVGDALNADLWAVGQTIPTDSDPEFITVVETLPPI